MRTTTYLCAALLVGVCAPLASSTDAFAGCTIKTSGDAVYLGGYYVRGTLGEFWEEANGVSGLQRRDSGCADGRVIPSDLCYYMGPDGLSRCTASTLAQEF